METNLLNLPDEIIAIIINCISDILSLARFGLVCKHLNYNIGKIGLTQLSKIVKNTELNLFDRIDPLNSKWINLIGSLPDLPHMINYNINSKSMKTVDINDVKKYRITNKSFESSCLIKQNNKTKILIGGIKSNNLNFINFAMRLNIDQENYRLNYADFIDIVGVYVLANSDKRHNIEQLLSKFNKEIKHKIIYGTLKVKLSHLMLSYFIGSEETTNYIIDGIVSTLHFGLDIIMDGDIQYTVGACGFYNGYGNVREFMEYADEILGWKIREKIKDEA